MNTSIIKTKIGLLKIVTDGILIHEVSIVKNENIVCNDKSLVDDVQNYFNGTSKKLLTNYIIIKGTTFQKLVWNEIEKIPYGETKSYGQIAEAIGHNSSYRAVANACGQNKIALFIPCHRVVGMNNIGGYHWGVENKKWLIEFEKTNLI